LIIALYWHRTLQQFDKNLVSLTVKLDKLTIPFLIVSIALVVLDVIGFILRVNWIEAGFSSLRTVNGVFWVVSMVVIGSLFVYSGAKILRHLWNHHSAAHEKIKLMTQKLIACAFGMFLFIVGTAISSSVSLFNIGSFLIFGGLNIMSLAQIMIFQSPATSQETSSLNVPTANNSTKSGGSSGSSGRDDQPNIEMETA